MAVDRWSTLEVEVLAQILELIIDSSPTTLKSLQLINKRFSATTVLVGHRQKKIEFTSERGKEGKKTDLKAWLEDEYILKGVRYLKVKTDHSSWRGYGRRHQQDSEPVNRSDLEDAKYDDLVRFITQASNLKQINWSSIEAIPAAVVTAIAKNHKNAELRVWNWHRWSDTADEKDSSEIALAESPNLTAIRAVIWQGPAHPDLRETALKRIVANAPSLRYVSATRGHGGGCVVYGRSMEQLEQVAEKSKAFFTHKKTNGSLKSLTLDGWSLQESTLREWGSLVELNSLESIKCSRGSPDISFFTYAPSVLSNLKHVSLNLANQGAALKKAVENYITACAPLETLSLWAWSGAISLKSILDTHGPTLRALHLHERETGVYDEHLRFLLSVEDIKSIADACPNLKEFTFDRQRHTVGLESELEEDAETFNILARMRLNRLQIYYDVGLGSFQSGDRNQLLISDNEEDDDDEEEEASDEDVDDDAVEDAHDSADSPQVKRVKREKKPKPVYRGPSNPDQAESFAGKLWKRLFVDTLQLDNTAGAPTPSPCVSGSRALDIKLGEWEKKMGAGYPAHWVIEEQNHRMFIMVRPKGRDDQWAECKIDRLGGAHYNHV